MQGAADYGKISTTDNSSFSVKVAVGVDRPKGEQAFLKRLNVYDVNTKTESEKLWQSNLNRGKGFEWEHNCQRCVVAWELIQRGYDVTAKPFNANDSIKNNGGVFWRFNTNWREDPNVRYGLSRFNLKPIIKQAFKDWGDGARVVIRVQWNETYGVNVGHFFTAKCVDGEIVYFDPQTNKIRNIDETLAKCTNKFGKLWFMRVDNRELTELVEEAVMNVRE